MERGNLYPRESPRFRKIKACQTKLRFSKRREAESAAAINTKRYGYDMGYYECDICRQYHLYTKEKTQYGKPRINQED